MQAIEILSQASESIGLLLTLTSAFAFVLMSVVAVLIIHTMGDK